MRLINNYSLFLSKVHIVSQFLFELLEFLSLFCEPPASSVLDQCSYFCYVMKSGLCVFYNAVRGVRAIKITLVISIIVVS